MNKILFIGPKAPPVTGYANITNSLNSCLEKKNINTTYFSTVPSLFSKFFPSLKWQIIRALYLLLIIPAVLIMIPFHKIIYINVNGGFGGIFDLIVAMLSKLMQKKIYLHHNSFSYINQQSFLAHCVFRLSGRDATHIVNSSSMKESLKRQYSMISNAIVISNASILTLDKPDYFTYHLHLSTKSKSECINLGFMGYMDENKGIDLFCETVTYLLQRGLSVNAVAVGPVHNNVYFQEIKNKFSNIVEFKGPAYGLDFELFFQDIDILLFPSKYKNEAEPLTVYHALSAGVPVLASKVGCLSNMLAEFSDSESFDELNYKENVLNYIENNLKKLRNRNDIRNSVVLEYQSISIKKVDHLKGFLSSLKTECTL